MSYVVVAPLVVAASQDAKLAYHYQGSVISWLSDADEKRFIADGLVVKAGAEVPFVSPDVRIDPPFNDGGLSVPVTKPGEKPAGTAVKEAWVDYAVSKGFKRAEAEEMSKAELVKALS